MSFRTAILIVTLVFQLPILAQELAVKEMKATNDLSASQYRRNDLNGQPCALVKVLLATTGATFEGNFIPPVEYKSGEYWVYMSEGSRELRIKHPSFVPLYVNFSDYGIKDVQSLVTYDLTLIMPQASTPLQTQKLIINYTPVSAMVLVDSKLCKGNGRVEVDLPIGSHNYIIAADGYETVEASVKLTASAPRTVTEALVASVLPVQQSTPIAVTQPSIPASQTLVPPSASNSSSAIETFTVNGVSFNMIRVDGGTFTMGATSEQGGDAYDDEKPVHQVTLSSYYIGETEVTQELWEAVMGSNPSYYDKGAKHPVVEVSWNDCQEFIRKLNTKTGRQFRLPTEAEWEYAARGGNKSLGYKYSGSNNLSEVAWYIDNSGSTPHDVKTKQANELGLYDMSGNVWEWCQDWHDEYSSSSQINPTGPSSGSFRFRVKRGGGYLFLARDCRVSIRDYDLPDSSQILLGLRLALQ